MSQALMEEKPKKKRKRRMRLPNGLGSVHKIGDGKSRRNPWRARVLAGVDFDVATGKATQKYITLGYFATEADGIQALMDYRKDPYTLDAAVCTFADVFEMWKEKKYPTISKSGQNGYNSAFKNSVALHNMKIRDIRTSHIGAQETSYEKLTNYADNSGWIPSTNPAQNFLGTSVQICYGTRYHPKELF